MEKVGRILQLKLQVTLKIFSFWHIFDWIKTKKNKALRFFGCFLKHLGLGLTQEGRPVGQLPTDDCPYKLL